MQENRKEEKAVVKAMEFSALTIYTKKEAEV